MAKKGAAKKKPATTKKRTASPVTGFSKPLGFFFLLVITVLFGLLLFNLIVFFGVESSTGDTTLQTTAKSKSSQGNVVDITRFTSDALSVTFDYPATLNIGTLELNNIESVTGLFTDVPTFSADGAIDSVISLETSSGSLDAAINQASGDNTTQAQTKVGSLSATEVTNSTTGDRTILFTFQGTTYIVRLSGAAENRGSVEVFEESLDVITQ